MYAWSVAAWGVIAAWVGAVGTVVVLWRTVGLVRREREDRRKEHARQLAAWRDEHTNLLLRNTGNQVFNYVLAFCYAHAGQKEPDGLDIVGDLGPEDTPRRVRFTPEADIEYAAWSVYFVDQYGRFWERTYTGKLIEHGHLTKHYGPRAEKSTFLQRALKPLGILRMQRRSVMADRNEPSRPAQPAVPDGDEQDQSNGQNR